MAARKWSFKPAPDFGRFDKVLRRTGVPDRVPLYELFSNIRLQTLEAIGKEVPPTPKADASRREKVEWEVRLNIQYNHVFGYDYGEVFAGQCGFSFPQKPAPKTMTKEGERSYLTGAHCTIANREDFDKYAWPNMAQLDLAPFEIAKKILPEGMKIITLGPGGVLENVMWLLGYENISLLLYDDEKFVADMFEAVGSRLVKFFDAAASIELVGALTLGDDMGFKTQTMLAPPQMRKYVFPWQKKIVETVHRHGKPAILHACGQLAGVWEDVIGCGWDAKHSFEDQIEPVWEIKKRSGNRISLLGGFDMDKICQMNEKQIRAHTRMMIEKCAPGGGWALGTGNSVANYVPVKNFLAMIDEGLKAGKY
jgi:uroporphyrinogen decarboxylase